jgi:hypothetical protein
MKKRPFVFIGSSAEGLEVAKAIQANLDYSYECQIWSQGLFGLSEGTLETLVNALEHFDFAILALTPDDLTHSRGTDQKSPRDNVLFELGLFIGGLGTERVYMVVDRAAQLKLPSDLAGITPATFQPPTSGTMQSAVGAACTAIEGKIKKLGARKGTGIDAWWWTGCLDDRVSENPEFFMTVANRSGNDVPWLNVHVFPSNTFRLEPRTGKTERLMAGQYAMYRFRMLEPDGQLTKWARRLAQNSREELSVRIFKENSISDAVLISYDLGAELFDRIHEFSASSIGSM